MANVSTGLTAEERAELIELRRIDRVSKLFTSAFRKATARPDLVAELGILERRAVCEGWQPRQVEAALAAPMALWVCDIKTICELAAARDAQPVQATRTRPPRTIASRFLV